MGLQRFFLVPASITTLDSKKCSDVLIGSCLNLLRLARYDNFGFGYCVKLNQ